LGLEFFEKVVSLQQKYGSNGQKICNSIQTNGILIDEDWARFLKKYNFLVGLSLDGNKIMHDSYRKRSDGTPTWEKVMNALDILKKFHVEFNILCVLTKANINKAKELFNFFVKNECYYLQFIPALECNDNGKRALFSPTSKEYGKFLCDLFDLWKDDNYRKVYIRTFDQILSFYLGIKNQTCPFGSACADYLVVEWNGDIYPCDFYVRPEYKLGNLKNDNFENLIEKRNIKFSKKRKNLSNECLSCFWRDICGGGCLKNRDFCENNTEYKTYFCYSYRKFLTYSYKFFLNIQAEYQREHNLPIHSYVKKINRNDLCPCGSGLKYKKCHGKN